MTNLTRRDFLGRSVAGAATLASLDALTYSRAFGMADEKPSERIQIGCIGIGNQGRGNMSKHIKNVTAVCEVDSKRLDEAAAKVEASSRRKPLAVSDYRKLLDSKDVDAVIITTPDHWHALPTIDACDAGKDVYCEKPLTLFITEGRAMVNAARRNKRIVQTGSQQRSDSRFRQACELVRNGAIGKVKTVRVGIPGVNFKGPAIPNSEPPAELDYDRWLGPAPKKPYNEKHVHYYFRFFTDYSGGQITNFGAHHMDIAQWGLGMDDSGPVEITGKGKFHPEGWYETPMWFECVYKYANGTTMICGMSERGGTTFEGEKGTIYVTRGKIEGAPKELLDTKLGSDAEKLYVSKDHHANWLECIKTRKLPICDVEIGHRSATVCHLGNMAIFSQEVVKWNPETEEVTSGGKAADMVSREYREPWKLKG